MHASAPENCLSYWYPRLVAAGVPTPETHIFHPDWAGGIPRTLELIGKVAVACGNWRLGWPLFMRTGHGAGKHEWRDTCFVNTHSRAHRNVHALYDWCATADLPPAVWVFRKMLRTNPLFRCTGYGGMPVVREWRFFARNGEIECVHPYWPADALEQGCSDAANWKGSLSRLHADPPPEAVEVATKAAKKFDGYWSLDVLEAVDGHYLTDMAGGLASWHWPGCQAAHERSIL